MGCDIHFYVESRNWDDTRWVSRDKWQADTYTDGDDCDGLWADGFYNGRNYNLFAILANVRNGRGFAGCYTGSGFRPMCEPRGLPEDVTLLVRHASDRYGVDGHSHSWLLLSELLEFDWDGQSTMLHGFFSKEEYEEFKESGVARSYCGGISGNNIRTANEPAYIAMRESGTLNSQYEWFVECDWPETYRQAVGENWFQCLDELAKLNKDPAKVRIVFWFDN